MEKQLITVMVPCYNIEQYLCKCLDSIVNQTYKNLEIILINDGSKDGTINVMKKYAEKDNRIAIIDRENKGIAFSRNEAISKAKGDYLTFIDGDDWITLDYMEKLIGAIQEENADLAICNVQQVKQGSKELPNYLYGKRVYNRLELFDNLISRSHFLDLAAAKLYSKKVFEGVEYPTNRIYEDSSTVFKIFNNVNKAVELYEDMYYYLTNRSDSIMGKPYVYKNLHDNYLSIKDRNVFLKEHAPELGDLIDLGFIRNILTLYDRAYSTADTEVLNSELMRTVNKELKEAYSKVCGSKEFNRILSPYKRSCLYFILQDKINDYIEMQNFINNK